MLSKARLTIGSVNLRREKAGDEPGEVAVDVKFRGTLSADETRGLFWTQGSHDRLLSQLYDDEGELRSIDVDQLTLSRKGEGVVAEIERLSGVIGAMHFEGAKFNQVKLVPRPGRAVDITCRLQVYPDGNQLESLADLIDTEVDLSVELAQADLVQRAENENDAAEDDGEDFTEDSVTLDAGQMAANQRRAQAQTSMEVE